MDKVVYLLVVSTILGSSLCVAQVIQTRSADAVPLPYSRSNYQGSIPSGSGQSNSESTQTVCENGKCEQVIRTCVNGLCTDKKLVSDAGVSGQSNSQSKQTKCVNGNCEEVITTCTNGVCSESKSNTVSNGYNPPIQPHFEVPTFRPYTAFPNDGFGFQRNFNDGFGAQSILNDGFGAQGNLNDVFGAQGSLNDGFGAQRNLNDGFGPVFNNGEQRPIYNNEETRHYYNNEESSHYQNNGESTPNFNNVQSRNREQHTECVNGVCKTVTKICNNGNCATTTQ
ncbi:unnamed protein product [Diamesa hyperborea]